MGEKENRNHFTIPRKGGRAHGDRNQEKIRFRLRPAQKGGRGKNL